MKLFSILAVVIAPIIASAQPIRVGTFHKPSVVVAFYRSPIWADTTRAKVAELDAARKAHDTAKVQELESWGAAHQELAHRQLTGNAPITNILEALSPGLREVASRAGVHLIVPDLPFADSTVETVDVTNLLLEYLKADSRTLSIVRDLQKR